jgi:cyclomaltodextrinase
MWGADDPDDRKPMLWPDLTYAPETSDPLNRPRASDQNQFDQDLFAYYQRLIQIRHQEPALCRGEFETLITDDQIQTYAFRRTLESDTVSTAINNSAQPQTIILKSSVPLRDLLTKPSKPRPPPN